jgi:hypothetical protein
MRKKGDSSQRDGMIWSVQRSPQFQCKEQAQIKSRRPDETGHVFYIFQAVNLPSYLHSVLSGEGITSPMSSSDVVTYSEKRGAWL